MQKVVRAMQIDTENRLLLEKMMRIDHTPQNLHPRSNEPLLTPSSLSLNRLARLKELVRVNDSNKVIVKRLKAVKGSYDVRKWDKEFNDKNYLASQIRKNASKIPFIEYHLERFITNQYFLKNPSTSSLYQNDIAKLPPRPGMGRPITASTVNSRNREATVKQLYTVQKEVPPFLAYAGGKLIEFAGRPQTTGTHHSRSSSKLPIFDHLFS